MPKDMVENHILPLFELLVRKVDNQDGLQVTILDSDSFENITEHELIFRHFRSLKSYAFNGKRVNVCEDRREI